MAPCKFYLQGNCKFGDRCKFDHPGAQNQGRNNQQNQNRFAAFGNANNTNQGGRGGQRGDSGPEFKFGLDPNTIQTDLTADRPIWPFSVYSPGRLAPRQLIEGPVMEQSPEEMRLRCYVAMSSGNPQQAVQDEAQLANEVNAQIQNILSDLGGACRYVQEGENMHPNRLDICKQAGAAPSQQPQQQQAGAFGNSTFGQPSAFGAAAQPPQGSAFGQPSTFGAAASQQQSAFGRPSAFGATAGQQPSAFGAPSALGAGNSAFGKPAFGASSAFGQPANNAGSNAGPAPAFGQPSQPGAFGQSTAGAFGAKPAFGQPAGGSAFGQAAPAGGGGAFGKPAAAPGFGQPAFGQPAQPAANSPFGQLGQQQQQQPLQQQQPQQQQGAFGQPAPNAFGQAPARPSAFGAPSQPAAPSAFGASSQPAAPSAFGAPTSLGAANAFGKPAGAPLANGFAATQSNGLTQPFSVSIGMGGVGGGTDVSTYSTRGPNNQLTSWKGQPVQYQDGVPCYRRPDNAQWERIWLPDGPPPENPYSHAPREVYGDVLKEAYRFLNQTGMFKDGIMPEEPPLPESISWDV